ncbi:MAG: hypothetical protein JXR69_11035 [Candidatus Delongbacteria bacterium]|nr:hypothetical protein [Candidatus Delongbacteria bacterium]
MSYIKDIFENLEGSWTLNREFVDLDTGVKHSASGNAVFKKNKANILAYEETGVLSLPENSANLNFTRKYLYELKDNAIHIILDDGINRGDLFQKLIPTEDERVFKGTEHLCVNDTYNGTYHFINENEFSIEIIKKGPRMNVEIKTSYRKK